MLVLLEKTYIFLVFENIDAHINKSDQKIADRFMVLNISSCSFLYKGLSFNIQIMAFLNSQMKNPPKQNQKKKLNRKNREIGELKK